MIGWVGQVDAEDVDVERPRVLAGLGAVWDALIEPDPLSVVMQDSRSVVNRHTQFARSGIPMCAITTGKGGARPLVR